MLLLLTVLMVLLFKVKQITISYLKMLIYYIQNSHLFKLDLSISRGARGRLRLRLRVYNKWQESYMVATPG
jgi:hypothetical protein